MLLKEDVGNDNGDVEEMDQDVEEMDHNDAQEVPNDKDEDPTADIERVFPLSGEPAESI